MKRTRQTMAVLCTALALAFLVLACGATAEQNEGPVNPGDSCESDEDCFNENSNLTCNVTAGRCVDHETCLSHDDCESWYGTRRPYCVAGLCSFNPPAEDGDETPPPVDGDEDPEEEVTCTDFTGFYDGTFACADGTETHDTMVAVDYINCSIVIHYNGQTVNGNVRKNSIRLTEGLSCTGSGEEFGDIDLSCDNGCDITLTPASPNPDDHLGEIRVQPSELRFGAVNAGEEVFRELTVSNLGTGDLTVYDMVLSGDAAALAEFSIEDASGDWTMPRVMEYGAESDLAIAYRPAVEAAREALLIVFSDSLSAPVTRIKLSSEVKAAPRIETDPPALDFGSSAPGFDNRKYFLAKNSGDATAFITNIYLKNDANGAYSLELVPESTPPFQIEPGKAQGIQINFNPIEDVHQPDTNQLGNACVVWRDREQNEKETCVDLLGTVTRLAPACIDIQPLEGVPGAWGMGEVAGPGIKFGYQQINTQISKEFQICNCGDKPLELTGFVWNEMSTGPPMSIRAFQEDPGAFQNYSLQRGQCIHLEIWYYPSQEGVLNTAAFQFNTNAESFSWMVGGTYPPDYPEEFKGLVMVGVSGIAARRGIEVLPSKLDFGLITIDCCSRPEDLVVYNVGDLTLTISKIEIGNGSDERFELIGLPTLPYNLGGSGNPQSMRFKTKFCPTFEGPHVGRVEITSNDANNGQFIVPMQGEGTTLTHHTDTFQQVTHPMVDILWVVDCSGSMGEEQENLKDNFGTFINEAISWNADLQIAVASTDIVTASHSGHFHGSPAFLKNRGPGAMTNDQLKREFEDRIMLGTDCDSGQEAGLEAAHLALSEPLISNDNAGFIREDAKLSIIFVSDEPDQSNPEVPFFIDFFRSIKGMRNTNMIEVYSIVGDKPDGCSSDNGSAAAGPRYIDVADACNRYDDEHFMSICASDYSPIYANLAENLFALRNQFFLSRLADPDTIVVTINGAITEDWEYDEPGNSIIFPEDSPPDPGAVITVEYDTLCLH